jgi:hypothetical protein
MFGSQARQVPRSYSYVTEDSGLLGCYTMLTDEYRPTCLNNLERVASLLGLPDLESKGNMIFRNVGDDLPMDTG